MTPLVRRNGNCTVSMKIEPKFGANIGGVALVAVAAVVALAACVQCRGARVLNTLLLVATPLNGQKFVYTRERGETAMSNEQQRPPPSLQQLLPCENEIIATQVGCCRVPRRSARSCFTLCDTLQPVALTLLSVEERLLLIDASSPLQDLSRLQKLVLAVSMQVRGIGLGA
jgi:hypothetical protein